MNVFDEKNNRTPARITLEGAINCLEERTAGWRTFSCFCVTLERQPLDQRVSGRVTRGRVTTVELLEQIAERTKRRLNEFDATCCRESGSSAPDRRLEVAKQTGFPYAGAAAQ